MRTGPVFWMGIAVLLVACSLLPGSELPEQLAATMVAQTEAARPPTDIPTVPPTLTPTVPPTQAPTDTPPPTPTSIPEGPISLRDNFSTDAGVWFDCEHCTVEDGVLHMGPFPVSFAYEQQWALCGPCGMVRTFRMAVDVRFERGPSERGFGLMLGLNDDEFFTYEITPWQTVDFWQYDYERQRWDWVNGVFAGSVRTGNQFNRIEIEAAENSGGRIDYTLGVNGRTPLVIFNREAGVGWVGMTLYGHAVELTFDNFEFETDETPIYPSGTQGQSG